MKLLQNTINGVRYKHWSLLEAFTYFLKGVARELNIAPKFFARINTKTVIRAFENKWLNKNKQCFEIKGVLLPYTPDRPDVIFDLAAYMLEDTFNFLLFFDDKYDKEIVERVDRYMKDGSYCYVDGLFDVTIKENDIVIDAGAWIGDFSAYAVFKGAKCYAFEPLKEYYEILEKTARLNDDLICPIEKGLGSSVCDTKISINGAGSSIILKQESAGEETISITTLDKFVEENKLGRLDFIKADIEGAEREMLKGAANVLKTFAPKLSICTYHLPDDPEVLEKLILEANPDYKVVHLQHKLFAAIVKQKS